MSSNTSTHQDWTPVVLKGKNPTNAKQTSYKIEDRMSGPGKEQVIRMAKLENESDVVQTPFIPHALSQEIIKARVAANMTQKEVAQKLNLPHSLITSYENGKAIPDSQTNQNLQKIAKSLNTKFTNKIVKPGKSN
jgi:ribosome-binding protein aMBF1 (putative translation factor)